ncbi:MAG: polysaccharide export protein [Saprospiraceae bacterium]|nr:polysaccharide export protein [Saprospiraceae bacterium]
MLRQLTYLLLLAVLLASCSQPQQLFQSPGPVTDNRNVLRQYFQPREPVIRPGDKLSLSIYGHEELSIGSANSVYNSDEVTGKWLVVDNDGEVNLPQIGRIKVAGYDIKEVNYLLEEKYRMLLKDPIINVRVVNQFVTVLGEVNKPGRYPLDNEQMSLVEILGSAAGLTHYAKGHEVKVIRQVQNRPVELVVDLTDLVTFNEYNVQLQPDDVVYIGPNENKGADEKLRRGTTIAGIVGGIALALSVILR